uniref:Peptidase M14 carboxypeptidase A domain-containing protein n=1 Tax=Plectus sambesii TaxID=2011161 RepID=A0A914WMJ0_9BILA
MVAPEGLAAFKNALDKEQFFYWVAIHNVEQHMAEEHYPELKTTVDDENLVKLRMRRDIESNFEDYDFTMYSEYARMARWMWTMQRRYPHLAKLLHLGTTHQERSIQGMKIGSPVNATNKRIVYIDGGMHAREWPSMHLALYFINELLTKYGKDPQITNYLDKLNFYIIPCVNPDGYEFSRSSEVRLTRMWRKNMAPKNCNGSAYGTVRCCEGVDLNRNFDFHWGGRWGERNPCSDVFQGSSPFSEPESRAIRDLLLSPDVKGKVDAFVTLHTHGQLFIHSYNHKRKTYPDDIEDLKRVGQQAIDAMESLQGTKYQLGSAIDLLGKFGPSTGGASDWAKSIGIKYSYGIELPPEQTTWFAFIMKPHLLIPAAEETWLGVKVIIDAVLALNHL